MVDVEIVRAGWRDAWELSRLERRCFSRADTLGWFEFLGLRLWPGVVLLKAIAGGSIVGFVAADPRRWSGQAVILTLGVDPTWRRQGVGQRLMRECEARLDVPVIRLQVRQSNTPAIALYRKLGYAIAHDLPRYYSDEDGYLMEKSRGRQDRQPRRDPE